MATTRSSGEEKEEEKGRGEGMGEGTEGKKEELKQYARYMRKNMTEEEGKLWHIYLKYVRPRFHRKQVIGEYIVDFSSKKSKLVIEIEEEQENDEEAREKERKRTEYLEKMGYKVIRYTRNRINNDLVEVKGEIEKKVKRRLKEIGSKEEFRLEEKERKE